MGRVPVRRGKPKTVEVGGGKAGSGEVMAGSSGGVTRPQRGLRRRFRVGGSGEVEAADLPIG
jgi:hypothetical protein